MKPFKYIALLLLLPVAVRAQRAAPDSLYLFQQNKQLVDFARQNATQLIGFDVSKLSEANISYQRADGHFRGSQTAENSGTVAFGTSGIATLGRFKMFGDFRFSRMREDSLAWSLKGVEEDVDPYYFAAIKAGTWERINYNMGGVLAYRLPGNHFYLATGLQYYYNTAARSVDPRASVQNFRLLTAPELVYQWGNQTVGINIDWGYEHEANSISYRNTNFSSGQGYPDRILYQVFGYGNFASAGVRTLRRQIAHSGLGLSYAYSATDKYIKATANYRYRSDDIFSQLVNSTNYSPYGSFFLHTTNFHLLAGKTNSRYRQQLAIDVSNNSGKDRNVTLGGSSYKYEDLLAAVGYNFQTDRHEFGLKLTYNDHTQRDLSVSHVFSYSYLQPELPLTWYFRYENADRFKFQIAPGARLPLAHQLNIPQGELNQVFNLNVSYPDLRYRTATTGTIRTAAEYVTPRLFKGVYSSLSADVLYQRALTDGVVNPTAPLQPSGGFLTAAFRFNIYF